MRPLDRYIYRGPYRTPRTISLPFRCDRKLWLLAGFWILFASVILNVGHIGRRQFESSLVTARPAVGESRTATLAEVAQRHKPKPIKSSGGLRATSNTPTRSIGGTSGYAYGHCTYYVASKRRVPQDWSSAGNWLSAAQADGYKTGTKPKKGAIAWTYGHVAYVEDSVDGKVLVSEMNYAGWNVVSRRWEAESYFKYIY